MTFWVAGAVVAGGIGSSLIGAGAASSAADTQASSVAQSNALQQAQFDQTRADQAPYREAGYSALGKLSDLLGLSGNTSAAGYGSLNQRYTGADLTSSPRYQLGLTEGTKALQGSAAAKGGLYSGATLKALQKYGQDYADTQYDVGYNQFNNDQDKTFNRLSGIAGTGQTATNNVDSAGATVAASQGGNLIGAGNARASSYLATGNAFGNAINSGIAAYGRTSTGGGSTPYTGTLGGGNVSFGTGTANDYINPGYDPYGG